MTKKFGKSTLVSRHTTQGTARAPHRRCVLVVRGDSIEAAPGIDLVVGAVLVPGAEAPKLITRNMVSRMKPGSVIVDVAIDQGGCAETAHATTHADPTYKVDGVVHYCVANMPGAVARTSTFALNNATIGHALTLADHGWKQAMRDNLHLRAGLNVALGQVTCAPVAQQLNLHYTPAEQLLK